MPTTKTSPKLSNCVILGVPSQDVSSTEKAKLAASALTTCGTDIAVFSRVRGNKILERLTVKDSNTPHSCDYRYNNESRADKGAINSGML